jgi:uncharacterized C2H2 Zn-finger protein
MLPSPEPYWISDDARRTILACLNRVSDDTGEEILTCYKCQRPFVLSSQYRKDVCMECDGKTDRRRAREKQWREKRKVSDKSL